MGRRSKQYKDTGPVARETAQRLLELAQMPELPLRERVRAVVRIAHDVRDIGSSLMPEHRSGRARILAYLLEHIGQLVPGEELFAVAGIDDWGRRVRELRVEKGWSIFSGATFAQLAEEDQLELASLEQALGIPVQAIGIEDYILVHSEPDKFAADHWRTLKILRNANMNVQDKVLALLRASVGQPISGEQFRYIAHEKSEWARRIRELRTEQGWPVLTRMQGRPDIPMGSYVLEEDRQAPPHDREISDAVRIEVLKRDQFRCRVCNWGRDQLDPADPRKFLELHHVHEHAKGGGNSADNLTTLCNVHHDQVHAGTLILP